MLFTGVFHCRPDQVKALLDDDEYRAFNARYGLDGEPNFEGKAWHLHTSMDWAQVAEAAGVDEDRARALVAGAKPKLFQIRSKRVWPARDEKILTSCGPNTGVQFKSKL